MSWDATLTVAGVEWAARDWNYTHNTNGMIAAALEAAGEGPTDQCDGPLGKVIGPAWWKRLHGLPGTEGGRLLSAIITGLESNPPRFRAMNPENGWGSYDQLLEVMREMRDACLTEAPMQWTVSG